VQRQYLLALGLCVAIVEAERSTPYFVPCLEERRDLDECGL
jgi:hypothetical protein